MTDDPVKRLRSAAYLFFEDWTGVTIDYDTAPKAAYRIESLTARAEAAEADAARLRKDRESQWLPDMTWRQWFYLCLWMMLGSILGSVIGGIIRAVAA